MENEVNLLYLSLLKKCLTDDIYGDVHPGSEITPRGGHSIRNYVRTILIKLFGSKNIKLVRKSTTKAEFRQHAAVAHTMIGSKGLDHLQKCILEVIQNKIPGDFIECGVWRGGTTIFMKGILKAYGITNRNIWVADSFKGLPKPDFRKYPADKGDRFHEHEYLRVSLETVQSNFRKYELLDNTICFLEGWFKDTLPSAPIKNLAILRIDGDMYESTWDALVNLYPKVSKGGYVIIDDYYVVPGCKKAVHDYREKEKISAQILKIADPYDGAYWKV